MIDLIYSATEQTVDLSRPDGGNIATSELLNTAVFISLFTRRRADDDDDLPDSGGHREGWWADAYPSNESDLIGSRLWLLRRSKATTATLNQARAYAEEALQWMVDDGIASSVVADVEAQDDSRLAFRVSITRPTVPASKWNGVWQAHLEEL